MKMKTFQQFNEDLRQLQKDLDTLEHQAGPKQRLAARRQAAKEISRSSEANFERRMAQQAVDAKEKHRQIRKDYEEKRRTSDRKSEPGFLDKVVTRIKSGITTGIKKGIKKGVKKLAPKF